MLSTFIALTEAAASTSDMQVLAARAQEVLRASISDVLAAYYELVEGRWVAQVATEGVPDDLLHLIERGLPVDTPCFAEAVRAQAPVFFDNWDAEEQRVPFTELFHAVGLAPYFQDEQPVAMLTVGFSSGYHWTFQQRQLFTAVYQALLGAQQRAVLAAQQERQLALDAFMRLTEAIGTETDRVKLAQRARNLLTELLPDWSVGYYELEAGLWRASVADVPDDALRRKLLAGLPEHTPGFVAAVQSGGPVFYEDWNAAEQQFEGTESYGAAAFYPYFRQGQGAAMFAIGSQHHQRWNPQDRAVLLAVGRSLQLALDRVWAAAELADSNASLRRSNLELLAANQELEAFTYSASHDLRTPVRHIKSFAELTRRALSSAEPERAERSLIIMESAADQMTLMIDAMLALSRSTQQTLAPVWVELETLYLQARQDVADTVGQRQITWKAGDLHRIRGDAATLRQVMTNLLSNAVKFTRNQPQAVIEVWSEEGADDWTVRVEDNGAGFDPAHAGRLFGAFQRLHLHDDFEGTGVGLATVRRIILRHGGRVFAHSQPGQGATFAFTLPK